MDRRGFLATLGGIGFATMAGCTAISDPSEPADAATAELAHVNGFAPSEPLSFDVSLVTNSWTVRPTDGPSHPAQVEVTVTNDSDEPKTVATGHREVFSTSRSDGGAYALIDEDRESEGNVLIADECWQLEEELVYPAVVMMMDLEVGESRSIVLDVVTRKGTDECLPTGTYVFSETYSIQDGDMSMNGSFQLEVSKDTQST